MKMTTLHAALAGACLVGAATLATAQSTPSAPARAAQPKQMENRTAGISGDELKREKDRIEADAKAAKEKCKSLQDNAQDICEAQAKGDEKLAKKELDYKKNPNERNRAEVEKTRAEVAYEVAKEKCEDRKDGQAECKRQAKEEKDRAVAGTKGKKVAASGAAGSRATGNGAAANGDTAGVRTPTTSEPAGVIANTMSPGQREPSDNTNVQTQGASTGVAGSATRSSGGTSGTANSEQGKSGQ